MIFPAEPIWIHGTEPITKGVRYSINCFLYPIKDSFKLNKNLNCLVDIKKNKK